MPQTATVNHTAVDNVVIVVSKGPGAASEPPSIYAQRMSTTTNTLADFPAESFAILAFCDTCGRQAPLDRAALPPSLTIDTLRRRLRCTTCGSRETAIRITYTGAGDFHYGGSGS